MRIRFSSGAVIGTTALVVALSGTAVAATGGVFSLGHTNTTTSNTIIKNTKGTALVFVAKKGIAPFSVNGDKVKVPSLNADELDGLDSTRFQLRVSGQCGSTAISAISATGSVTCMTSHHLFFTSGTATFTVPAGITQVELTARGGGGSGGSSGTTANLGRGGGGGQGGASTTLVSVTAGQLYTVVVGAGGAAPTTAIANGAPGAKSSVILTPSADATKFAAVGNGGGAGAAAVLCSATNGAAGGDAGAAPGPTGTGALGLSAANASGGSDAGTTASTDGCASGGVGGAAGYAGAGGNGGTPSTTAPVAATAGAAGLVEVTLLD